MRNRLTALLFALCAVVALPAQPRAAAGKLAPTPVIFDTDIGTDIDDAYALAVLIKRPEVRVLGVTTVSSDAVARARLAAKLLAAAGAKWASLPVYAGISTPVQYMKQVEWANGFKSPSLHESGAVEFMRREIDAHPGEVTIIAVGELTNVAALLDSEPDIGSRIRAISLMGGSVYRGYAPGSKPEPEWNIKSNAKAAQTVFASGVPLLIAPLDSTADLKMTPEMRVEVFSSGVPLNDALAALNSVWRHTNTWKGENPTLFDVLAVNLVAARASYKLTALHIEVNADGLTTPMSGLTPNTEVALDVDAMQFMRETIGLLVR